VDDTFQAVTTYLPYK